MVHKQDELGKDPLHQAKEVINGNVGCLDQDEEMQISQTSRYSKENKPRINNNVFFQERSNPLSSKGD